jgi:hypothetical protein
MKHLILKLLIILPLSNILSQTIFPPFNDTKKQFLFERNRIYINESKGVVPLIYGGASKITLADPLYRAKGNDPQYVSKQAPLRSTYKYYHNFSIEYDGKQISELDLLSLIGLEEEKNKIINNFNEKVLEWEKEVSEFEKGDQFYTTEKKMSPLTSIMGGDEITTEYCLYYPLAFCGSLFTLSGIIGEGTWGRTPLVWGVISFGILIYDKTTEVIKTEKHKNTPRGKPELRQSLSNNQIKGLVESYNKNLYNKIKSSK